MIFSRLAFAPPLSGEDWGHGGKPETLCGEASKVRVENLGFPRTCDKATTLATTIAVISVSVLAMGGCSGGNAQVPESPFGRARNGNLQIEGLSVVTADLDSDGEPDQWTYFAQNNNLIRAERDIDFDGRVDLYEYYDSSGVVIEEEMHLDFDDMIDVVRFYRGENLLRRELAVGFSADFAVVKYYNAEGEVLRVERDASGDGRIDTWEYFEDGRVIRVGRDNDGDGTPEVMEEAP